MFATANVFRLISIFIPVSVLINDTASAPPGFCCLCNLCNICYVWSQFHNNRLFCDFLICGQLLLHALHPVRKAKESCIDIRAGNVDFHHIDRFIRKAFYHFKILFRCMSADIHNDLGIIVFQIRNISFTEQIDSRILKSYGVQHASVNLCYTRVGLPGHGTFATPFVVTAPSLFRSTNSENSSPEPKCSRCYCNRVLPFYSGDVYIHIH